MFTSADDSFTQIDSSAHEAPLSCVPEDARFYVGELVSICASSYTGWTHILSGPFVEKDFRGLLLRVFYEISPTGDKRFDRNHTLEICDGDNKSGEFRVFAATDILELSTSSLWLRKSRKEEQSLPYLQKLTATGRSVIASVSARLKRYVDFRREK